jgi:hypothetical protein
MLLRIACRCLQVADCRMTTTVKRVLTEPSVASAPSLMGPWLGNSMLDCRPFPQRRPAMCGPERGTPLLLERRILADGQRPALPEPGGGAPRSLGTHGTGRKLHSAAQ